MQTEKEADILQPAVDHQLSHSSTNNDVIIHENLFTIDVGGNTGNTLCSNHRNWTLNESLHMQNDYVISESYSEPRHSCVLIDELDEFGCQLPDHNHDMRSYLVNCEPSRSYSNDYDLDDHGRDVCDHWNVELDLTHIMPEENRASSASMCTERYLNDEFQIRGHTSVSICSDDSFMSTLEQPYIVGGETEWLPPSPSNNEFHLWHHRHTKVYYKIAYVDPLDYIIL